MNFQSIPFDQSTLLRFYPQFKFLSGMPFFNPYQYPIQQQIIQKQEIAPQNFNNFQVNHIQTKSEDQLSDSIKFEQEVKLELVKQESTTSTKCEIEQNAPITDSPIILSPLNQEKDLKMELEKMLDFVLFHMGKDDQKQIEEARRFYAQCSNPCLLQIFNKLVIKYYSAKKGKEDIIRYIFRKAFKAIKTSIMKQEKINGKKASLLFCQKYLPIDPIQFGEIDYSDEEKFLELAMPNNKNSKNKTMNTKFVLEIFKSESFLQAYINFLPELNAILVEDNNKRKQKFVEVLLLCAKKNEYSKIGSFPRLPWLDVWSEDTKNLAVAIMPGKRLIYNVKKPKY